MQGTCLDSISRVGRELETDARMKSDQAVIVLRKDCTLRVTQDGVHHPEQALVVPSHQHLEQLDLSADDAPDHGLVTELGSGSRLHAVQHSGHGPLDRRHRPMLLGSAGPGHGRARTSPARQIQSREHGKGFTSPTAVLRLYKFFANAAGVR